MPNASKTLEVFQTLFSFLKSNMPSSTECLDAYLGPDMIPVFPTLPQETTLESIEKGVRDTFSWFILSSDPVYQVSKIQCKKAYENCKDKYLTVKMTFVKLYDIF